MEFKKVVRNCTGFDWQAPYKQIPHFQLKNAPLFSLTHPGRHIKVNFMFGAGMCSGHACRVLWIHVLNMCCDLLDVKMWCEFFYFATRYTREAVRGKGIKMPSICPWGFIWVNRNPISTSEVDVHLALVVTWHVWLGVGPQLAQRYDIAYALVRLWLCGLLSRSSVVLTH